MEKDIPCNVHEKQAGLVILISDKINFKTQCNERQRRAFPNVNPTRGYNICKYLCAQQKTT